MLIMMMKKKENNKKDEEEKKFSLANIPFKPRSIYPPHINDIAEACSRPPFVCSGWMFQKKIHLIQLVIIIIKVKHICERSCVCCWNKLVSL